MSSERRFKARKPSLLQKVLRAPSRKYHNPELESTQPATHTGPTRSPYFTHSVGSSSSVSIYSQPSPPAATAAASGWDWTQPRPAQPQPQPQPQPGPSSASADGPAFGGRAVRSKPSMTYSSTTSYYTACEQSSSTSSPPRLRSTPSLSSSSSTESAESAESAQAPLTPTTSQAEGRGDPSGLDCVAEELGECEVRAEVRVPELAPDRQRRTPAALAHVPLVPGKLYSFNELCSAASLLSVASTFPSAPVRSPTFSQRTPVQRTSLGSHAQPRGEPSSSGTRLIPAVKLTRTESDQAREGERGSIELLRPAPSALDEAQAPSSGISTGPITGSISRKKSTRSSKSAPPASHQSGASYEVVASSSPSLRQLLLAAETALPSSSAGSASSRTSRSRSRSPFEVPPAPLPPCPTLLTPSDVETAGWVKNLRALGEPLKPYEPPKERTLPPARPPRPAKSIKRAKQAFKTRDELLAGGDQLKSAEERVRSVGFVMPAEVRKLQELGQLPKPAKPAPPDEDGDSDEYDDPVKAWAMMSARGIAGMGMRA